ncbi:MAG: hypothetical protein KDC83_11005 [Flavobacteriales bacterium]|nr:hypothetical protein [Flavobacteriales bacterium]
MVEAAEIIGLLLFISVKFLFGPTAVIALGYSFWQTILISIVGGWMGVFAFYYGGSWLFELISKYTKTKNRKKFTKKNRFVIWLKNGFGLNGLAFVLGWGSIPIVCLIAAKYFRHDSRTIYYMLGSIVVWTFVLTGLSILLKPYFLMLL